MDIDLKEIITHVLPFAEALLILAAGHLIAKYFVKLANKAMMRMKLDKLLVNLIGKTLSITIHIIVILSALTAIGISTTGLLAALSAAAAGVALALKDSLSNIAGGIVLLTSHRFVAGDYIHVNDYEGKVVSVDLMHTTILTYNARQVSIPNGVLMNSEIANLSSEGLRRVDIDFPVPYGTDIQRAREVVMGVMKSHPLAVTDQNHIPSAKVTDYAGSAVILTTRTWCKHEHYWSVFYDLMEQFLTAMSKEGIEVPFNRIDIASVDVKTEPK